MLAFDHAFVFLICIVYPAVSFFSFRRLLARIADGEVVDRQQLYRGTIISHWTLFLVCLGFWAGADRSWTELGFGLQVDFYFALAALVTIAGIAILLIQLRQTQNASPDELNRLRSQLGNVAIMIPRNRAELVRFNGLSITAGIVEEVLWRGFLIWYFSQFMPWWLAAVVSTIAFGLAHAYQGKSQLPQLTLVGGVFAVLFLLSGSLWLPIILHAAVDILQGRVAHTALMRADNGSDASAPDTDTLHGDT